MAKQTGGTDLLTLAMRRAHAETASMPDGAGTVDDGADVSLERELKRSSEEAPAQEPRVERPL